MEFGQSSKCGDPIAGLVLVVMNASGVGRGVVGKRNPSASK